MGKIEAICISRNKGTVKKEIDSAYLKCNYGIVGDAHAGNWHRQVSLLAKESISRMKEKIPELSNGAFAENIITNGLQYSQIHVGSQLLLGEDIVLEVTQIGKKCHTACAIRSWVGDCIMPREGLFCEVVHSGKLALGDAISVINAGSAVNRETFTHNRVG